MSEPNQSLADAAKLINEGMRPDFPPPAIIDALHEILLAQDPDVVAAQAAAAWTTQRMIGWCIRCMAWVEANAKTGHCPVCGASTMEDPEVTFEKQS